VLGGDAEVLASMPGSSLEGVRYRRPFDLVGIPIGPDGRFLMDVGLVGGFSS
jgi:hypothetical protein